MFYNKYTMEERLDYFKNDETTKRIIKYFRENYGSRVQQIAAIDYWRELSPGYMVYVVMGLTRAELLEAGKALNPDYSEENGELENIPFYFIWDDMKSETPEYVDLTDMEV